MDFNKAFLAYDTVEGGICLTSDRKMSQMEAALLAVRAVGLGQIGEISEEWFSDNAICDMFFRRLEILKTCHGSMTSGRSRGRLQTGESSLR